MLGCVLEKIPFIQCTKFSSVARLFATNHKFIIREMHRMSGILKDSPGDSPGSSIPANSELFNSRNPDWASDLMDAALSQNYVEIIKNCKEANDWGVLAMIPLLTEAPPLIHFLVGCTLFRLNRIGGALRHLSIAIELEFDRREEFILHLIGFLRRLGMTEQVIQCFGEVIWMANVEKVLATRDSTGVLDEKIEAYNTDLKSEMGGSTMVLAVDHLHVQAKNYVQGGGKLCDGLAKECIFVYESTVEIEQQLTNWLEYRTSDPLGLLVDCIVLNGPNYLFSRIAAQRKLLETIMNHEQSRYLGINFRASPENMIKQIKSWENGLFSANSLTSQIIKHKIIKAYLDYFNHEYEKAALGFSWCFEFFERLQNNLRPEHGSIIQMSVGLYCLQSYCFQRGDYLVLEGNGNTSEYISLESVYAKFTHKYINNTNNAKHFMFLAQIQEKLSTQRSRFFTAGDSTIARPHEDHITEMLYQYVICSCILPPDDPSIIQVLDRIIWGLVMHGGIHLYTLWFFLLLKDHFCIEVDFYPMVLAPEHDYRTFDNTDILGKYTNGWEFVDKTYDLCKTVVVKKKIWGSSAQKYVIPRVFLEQGRLLILIGEDQECLENRYTFVESHQVKLKRGCFKPGIPKIETWKEDAIALSHELVSLWLTLYHEKHGGVPEIVQLCYEVFVHNIEAL